MELRGYFATHMGDGGLGHWFLKTTRLEFYNVVFIQYNHYVDKSLLVHPKWGYIL